MKPIQSIPESLQKATQVNYEKFLQSLTEKNLKLPQDATFQQQLCKSLACSDFISQVLIKSPEVLIELLESNVLFTKTSTHHYVTELKNALQGKTTETDLIQTLRRFRQKHMLRIAWRDINFLAHLDEVMNELSSLADVVLNISLTYLSKLLQKKHPIPIDEQGNISEFNILALGKLGSFELNFSSDIDLIFCYNNVLKEHELFFTKLAQSLINVLNRITEEGFVFRVDMRLRPFGSSGPLVCNHKTITSYFQTQGREWERFALAKARLINPSFSGERLLQIIRNFVYRRHTDFSIINSLRELKGRMRRESQNCENNIKRGPGGIREVEFIVQVFQLIRGGKEPWFQNASIFNSLTNLAKYHCLPDNVVQELVDAYRFLRLTEHHLQEIQDQQTQTLPSDLKQQSQLCYSLNFSDYGSFLIVLNQHREKVLSHFNAMIAPPKDHKNNQLVPDQRLIILLLGKLSEEDSCRLLRSLGDQQPEETLKILQAVMRRYNFTVINSGVIPKLALLLQQIFSIIFNAPEATKILSRVLNIFEQIVRRSIYLDLLIENPIAIVQLIKVCGISSWITNLLTEHPFLLDELIDQQTLYQPYSTLMLNDQLRQHMLSIPIDDLEQQMDCLRRFKQIQILRVAVSDATGSLPLMKISDHLSNTATVIVAHTQRTAWQHLVLKHGNPTSDNHLMAWDDFGIIAYGKLGGLELSYSSDLDLVFIHPETKPSDMTDGEKPISNMQFYLRLAQRITHILSIGTSMGNLYNVDTRLRPEGQSGLLVSSFKSYSNYLTEKAWTWELQALIRARMIVGSNVLQKNFSQLRKAVLSKKREANTLQKEIAEMRKKMLQQLPQRDPNCIDINTDQDGIKDIEFITQYLALRHAYEQPALIEYSDNIRILEALEKYGYLPSEDAVNLSHSYCKLREIIHRFALENQPTVIKRSEVVEFINPVHLIWEKLF